MKQLHVLLLASLLVGQTGCTSIRYSLAEEAEGTVAFTSVSGKPVGRPMKSETRSYFAGLGFVNVNDLVPALGKPLDALAAKAKRAGKKASRVAIVEETSLIDWALQTAVSVVGLGGWFYAGSRTSTVTAQAEE